MLPGSAVRRNAQRFRHGWGLSWRIAVRASSLPCLAEPQPGFLG